MKRVGKRAVAMAGLVLASGCASNRQLLEVSRRVTDLERGREVFEEEAQGLRTRSADISADFAAIEQRIREIEGRLEGVERRPAARVTSPAGPRDAVDQQMVERQLALQNRVLDIERRLGMPSPAVSAAPDTMAIPAPVPAPAAEPAAAPGFRIDPLAPAAEPTRPPPDFVPPVPRTVPTPVPVPAVADAADVGDPTDERQERYRVAYRAFREGRFNEAREEFTRYLAADPDPELADNAQFWVADSFYAQKQYEDALVAYDRVIKDYPKGDKVPQALLKQAYCFLQLEYPLDARVLLKKLVDTYPDSDEAKIARDKLRTLPRR